MELVSWFSQPLVAAGDCGRRWSGLDEDVLAVIAQFTDGLVDIGARQVRRFLAVPAGHRRHPAPRQLLQRADVEIAVMKELLELWHQSCKKTPVLTDTVTAHRRRAGRHMSAQEQQRLALGFGDRHAT